MRLRSKEVNVNQEIAVPTMSWLKQAYLWACERLYDEMAWQYDLISWLVSAGQWRRWQAGIWGEVQGQDVLELGCGTGSMLAEGVTRGLHIVGVDRSPRMLAVARTVLEKKRIACPLLLSDGRELPIQDSCLDTIFATFPAGYILDEETLREVRRVLRSEGRLVIVGLWVELHLGGLERIIPVFYGRPHATALEAILQRVEQAGFVGKWIAQREGFFSVGGIVAERG